MLARPIVRRRLFCSPPAGPSRAARPPPSPTTCRPLLAACPKALRNGRRTSPAYPAVHDMPPKRNSVVLSDEEQKKLEADLAAARNRAQQSQPPSLLPAPATHDKSRADPPAERRRAASKTGVMEEFHRIRRLPPYVFEQVNRAKAEARNAGADIIDLGMGNPDLPAPAHVIEKLKDTLGKPRTDRYSASQGHPGPAPRAGGLLRAPVRREAQSGHPDRRHARLEGGLRQRGPGDHRAGRRRAGARSELSDPRLRLPDGGRRHPLGAVRADAGVLRALERAIVHSIPKPLAVVVCYPSNPDRLCRRSRLLQGAGPVREEARHLRAVRSRLCRSLFRRQTAALGAAGAGRDGHRRRVHLDVEDLLDAGLAHGLCGRQRAHHRGARRG